MTKRRWWKWFGVGAGLILCIEACMLMVEAPNGNELPMRYRITRWFDELFTRPVAPPVFVKTVVNLEEPIDVEEADGVPLVSVGAGSAPAKPSPDWPMFGRTVARNMADPFAKDVPIDWSAEEGKFKNIKWSAELGTKSYGGPVIADGKVFFGTNNGNPRDKKIKGAKGILMCFNEADGKFLWQTVHDVPADRVSRDAEPFGICSTPCVEGKRHYYLTPGCDVICADNDSGKVIWRHDLVAKDKVVPWKMGASSPLIVDDLVMVVTGNGVDDEGKPAAPTAPSFIALRKGTGETAWQSNLPSKAIIEGQWANPAVAVVGGKKQVIFPGGDCWLYSFAPATGKLLWKCNCNPKRDPSFTPYIVATPVVYAERCYIGLGCCPDSAVEDHIRYSYLLCIDVTKTGDVSPVNLNAKDPANKASGLVWAYGGPINPRPKRGRRNYFGRTMSTCAIHDGLVYAAEFSGFLHCFDARTGEHYWEDDLRVGGIWGSPCYMDGKVYLGADDGQVFIYAHGKKLKKLATIEMDKGVHSTPVWANGVLYIATLERLYAIAAKK